MRADSSRSPTSLSRRADSAPITAAPSDGRHGAVVDALGVAADRGQRRLELVADRQQEALFGLLRFGQLGVHVVERGRQLAQLARALRLHGTPASPRRAGRSPRPPAAPVARRRATAARRPAGPARRSAPGRGTDGHSRASGTGGENDRELVGTVCVVTDIAGADAPGHDLAFRGEVGRARCRWRSRALQARTAQAGSTRAGLLRRACPTRRPRRVRARRNWSARAALSRAPARPRALADVFARPTISGASSAQPGSSPASCTGPVALSQLR